MPEVKSVHLHCDRHSKSKRESLALTDQEVVVKINRHNGSLGKGGSSQILLKRFTQVQTANISAESNPDEESRHNKSVSVS